MYSGKPPQFPIKGLIILVLTWAMVACSGGPYSGEEGTSLNLDEPQRPQYHFTPVEKWMNDPNGMVFYDDEYHLFYQHNPHDTVWGPMHWGHAVSTDLVNWQHLPIALYPDDIGTIFSGSAVIDWQNTAGFGEEAMVAIFTHDASGRQMQSLAYSTDRGRTWTKHEGNPVIEPPNNIRNFRDPKVFWYPEGEAGGHWVMVVSAGSVILFYTSPDLINWESSGGFGPGQGATCGVWETPDLFELPVDGGPQTRWVLAVAIGDCAPAGGSGIQYFIGDFDGQTFTNENDKDVILWADYGADFYAPQSWSDIEDERRIWAAWMNNWRYANVIPTSTWRGALTLPRTLSLTETGEGVRLQQTPVKELRELRSEGEWSWTDITLGPDSEILTAEVSGERLEIIAEFIVENPPAADRFGIRVRSAGEEYTTIGYATKGRSMFVDRSTSGAVDFHEAFPAAHTAPMRPINGLVRLHIFVDRSSVEVLGNDGLVSMTDRIFPAGDSQGVEVFVDGGEFVLQSLTIYQLAPASFFIPADGEE